MNISSCPNNAGVAQQVEQLTCNQQVGGSIPSASSKRNKVATQKSRPYFFSGKYGTESNPGGRKFKRKCMHFRPRRARMAGEPIIRADSATRRDNKVARDSVRQLQGAYIFCGKCGRLLLCQKTRSASRAEPVPPCAPSGLPAGLLYIYEKMHAFSPKAREDGRGAYHSSGQCNEKEDNKVQTTVVNLFRHIKKWTGIDKLHVHLCRHE